MGADSAIAAEYRRKVRAELDPMKEEVKVKIAKVSGLLALSVLSDLALEWIPRLKGKAIRISEWFTKTSNKSAKRKVNKMLEEYGIATANPDLEFLIDDEMKEIVIENVGLITSLAESYFHDIRMAIYKSLQTGGADQQTIMKAITDNGGKVDRRTKFIAQDQTAKAMGLMSRTRTVAAGITKGVWLHSSAGMVPRPGHVAANGMVFDLKQGAYLDNRGGKSKTPKMGWTWPGHEPRCRCSYKPLLDNDLDENTK